MPHRPKPFYRSARGAFYCQIGTKQIKLASGPDDPATEKLAWAEFHRVMAAAGSPPPRPDAAGGFSATSLPQSAGMSAAEVFDKFLGWCQQHRRPRTYEFYRERVQSFVDHLGPLALEPASGLIPNPADA